MTQPQAGAPERDKGKDARPEASSLKRRACPACGHPGGMGFCPVCHVEKKGKDKFVEQRVRRDQG